MYLCKSNSYIFQRRNQSLNMGKPFKEELKKLSYTIQWAEQQDVSGLARFLFDENKQTPLVCVGSGGSLSACQYAALLYQQYNGVIAQAMTPLQLICAGHNVIRNSKLLFLSASGKNKDIINALKYGVKYNEAGMMCLTLHKGNPAEELIEHYTKVKHWCEDIPVGKDGFLATNSLVATFAILCKAAVGSAFCFPRTILNGLNSGNNGLKLNEIKNFMVLYGAAGEPVAWDIESKLTEAALGATLLSDYRNFGHGRHHWFAKCKDSSCIIALISPVEKELAIKTIKGLPADVSVIFIESDLEMPYASIDMLLQAFRFVNDLGEIRGIDPGRPGVPSFGRLLYNLNYYSLTNRILPTEKIIDVAVRRKLGSEAQGNASLWQYYMDACKDFVRCLNKGKYNTIAFDYDGTLSANDHISRYNVVLCDKIKHALQVLLESGIEIRVATGRGKSVGSVFMKSFDQKYWAQIKIGYYNGACLLTLGEEHRLEEWKNKPLDQELNFLKDEIEQRLPVKCVRYKIEERSMQLSIEGDMSPEESQIVYDICHEVIWDRQLRNIRVWRSSHSMDIVVYHDVSKLSVCESPDTTLCIGDYGCIEGNDYELLTSRASLSVDKVSKNASCCWNIAPSGVSGLDATLYYLSRITVSNGFIKCKFNV